MLLQLSKNAFVRQYGPFTYIRERITSYDEMFVDAEVFMRWIGRTPMQKEEVLERICQVYSGTDPRVIAADFDDFLAPLIKDKIVLCGESADEISAQEISFSYEVENPKTIPVQKINPENVPGGAIPQEVLEKYFAEHPTIFVLQIDITQACTERCIHCYIPEYNPVFLPYDQITKVIDELRDQGGVGITITGGECMLHPDFDRIIRYAREKDLIVEVLSNLTLCTDEKVKVLVEAEATVQVSLYSMNPETHDAITNRPGSFEETMTAIRKLREAQVPCCISCPTMKPNYKDYLDVLKFARSLKMDARTDFIIMGKMDRDTSNLACRLNLAETKHVIEDVVNKSLPVNNEYFNPAKNDLLESDEEFAKRKVCGACVSSVCLDATGYYYPCPAFGGVNLGSCYDHDLKWIWTESPETMRIRSLCGRNFKKCLKCADRAYCAICMCKNFNETGDVTTPAQHFCDVAKINHEVVDEAQAKRLAGEKQ